MAQSTKFPLGVTLRVASGVSLLVFLWCFTPPDPPAFQLCGFHWLTGRPCPLCGLTRAMFALAKGHWRDAIHLHPLSPLAFAMLAGLLWSDGPLRGRFWTYAIVAFAIYGGCRILLYTA